MGFTSASARDERGSGWSIRSRTDEAGRILFSIYIGDRLVVEDALNSDAAVIAARKWIQSRMGGRARRGGAGGSGGRDAEAPGEGGAAGNGVEW